MRRASCTRCSVLQCVAVCCCVVQCVAVCCGALQCCGALMRESTHTVCFDAIEREHTSQCRARLIESMALLIESVALLIEYRGCLNNEGHF